MKNLGTASSLLLLAMLAGLRARTWGTPGGTGAGLGARATVTGNHPERGDVPGWVMITLMSAVLVAGLLALAGPALETMFNQAMDTVGK